MREIQVPGAGSPKCRKLTENAGKAVAELGVEAEVEKVTDLARIADLGVMATPALALDGRVRSVGRLLRVDEIKALLEER
jgi:small redox-active disulfide protein 2